MELWINDLKEEQRQIAEVIGMEPYLELTKMFGGTSIYIAKADELMKRKDRDRRIREEFDGSNFSQLAVKYGLTEVWIRNIVYGKPAQSGKNP